MATGEPFRNSKHPPMINLEDDRLSFTFPEIAGQLRAHVERQIGHILPEFLRPEERTASLAEGENQSGRGVALGLPVRAPTPPSSAHREKPG